jgi:hypothetical protein
LIDEPRLDDILSRLTFIGAGNYMVVTEYVEIAVAVFN